MLEARYKAETRRPRQLMYVELKAQVVPPRKEQTVPGYEANIRVDTVLTATDQVPMECRPTRLTGATGATRTAGAH